MATLSNASSIDQDRRKKLIELWNCTEIPGLDKIFNPGLFMERPVLSRLLYIDFLYKNIIEVPGVVMEFGVRWGQNLALFCNLRGMYEPYNYNRKIIGFDTFVGFPETTAEDGERLSAGDYGVSEGYKEFLEDLLHLHEAGSPISHLKKFEIVAGDATETLPSYLAEHPETMISLAYFDFDIYKPTKVCLELVRDRLVKGSVLAFDELNAPQFPGETMAVMEVLGLANLRLRRTPHNPLCAYVIVD